MGGKLSEGGKPTRIQGHPPYVPYHRYNQTAGDRYKERDKPTQLLLGTYNARGPGTSELWEQRFAVDRKNVERVLFFELEEGLDADGGFGGERLLSCSRLCVSLERKRGKSARSTYPT